MIGDRKCGLQQRVENDGKAIASTSPCSCSITHLKINQQPVPAAGPEPRSPLASLCRSDHVHFLGVHLIATAIPSPAYSGHGLRSSCLRRVSGSHVLRIHSQEGLDSHHTRTNTQIRPVCQHDLITPPSPPPPPPILSPFQK